MRKGVSLLLSKINMLGYKAEVINNKSIVAKDINSDKKVIFFRDGDNVSISREYDEIKSLYGSEYYLVRYEEVYGVNYEGKSIYKGAQYKKLTKPILTSKGIYNIVAKLDNGLYGVIDVEDNTIIPFINSSIEVYNSNGSWVYVTTTVDCRRVYNEVGEEYGVSKVIGNGDIIVTKDYILIYKVDKLRNEGVFSVYNLAGDRAVKEDGSNIVKMGSHYRLVNRYGEIILDKIYIVGKQ